MASIEHGSKQGSAEVYFVLLNTISCVLHYELRASIKILTQLLIEGLSNTLAGGSRTVEDGDGQTEGSRIKKFLEDVEKIMNREVLGSRNNPAQWKMPYDPKTKEICVLTMDGVRLRKVLGSFELLVDRCVTDEERNRLWKKALCHYRSSLAFLCSHDDLTDEQIVEFQREADYFFKTWIHDLKLGREGLTNYFHILGSGHFSEYLFHWRNMYQHSQQGWKAFNALVKNYYFKRTQRGGGRYGVRSRLKPIGKWLQRRMVFMLGITLEEIRQAAIDDTNTN